MKVSVELIFNCLCDHCQLWWSISDIAPKTSTELTCTHCGKRNTIEQITHHCTRNLGEVADIGKMLAMLDPNNKATSRLL